jgi:hypothetical protein
LQELKMSTTTHKQELNRVQDAIVRGHRAGVCDSDGRSVEVNGVMTAKPRNCRPTHRWVKGVGWVEC